jgi:hypothetical protein
VHPANRRVTPYTARNLWLMTLASVFCVLGCHKSSVLIPWRSAVSWCPLCRIEGVAMMRAAASRDDRETVERLAHRQSALTVLDG